MMGLEGGKTAAAAPPVAPADSSAPSTAAGMGDSSSNVPLPTLGLRSGESGVVMINNN